MKITYEFADGTHSVVEVDEKIGMLIEESRRLEKNLERKERRHCRPLFENDDKCEELADERDPLWYLERNETERETWEKIDALTETQRRRLLMKMEGLSVMEIARREGCNHKTVKETLEQVKKKLQGQI